MQAPDGGAGGAEGPGHSGQSGAGSAGDSGDDGTYAGALPRVVQIPHGLWPFGDIVLVTRRTAMHLHELRWVAQDRSHLQTVFNHFLDHLALLLRTMQHFGPPFPPASLLGKGG